MTGCELLSLVRGVVCVVSDVKLASNVPVNGLVSDFTVTGVVETILLSTENTRKSNTIKMAVKYSRKKAMLPTSAHEQVYDTKTRAAEQATPPLRMSVCVSAHSC